MGSGSETVEETVKALNAAGRKTGVIVVPAVNSSFLTGTFNKV